MLKIVEYFHTNVYNKIGMKVLRFFIMFLCLTFLYPLSFRFPFYVVKNYEEDTEYTTIRCEDIDNDNIKDNHTNIILNTDKEQITNTDKDNQNNMQNNSNEIEPISNEDIITTETNTKSTEYLQPNIKLDIEKIFNFIKSTSLNNYYFIENFYNNDNTLRIKRIKDGDIQEVNNYTQILLDIIDNNTNVTLKELDFNTNNLFIITFDKLELILSAYL